MCRVVRRVRITALVSNRRGSCSPVLLALSPCHLARPPGARRPGLAGALRPRLAGPDCRRLAHPHPPRLAGPCRRHLARLRRQFVRCSSCRSSRCLIWSRRGVIRRRLVVMLSVVVSSWW